jgi:hypothetical protein
MLFMPVKSRKTMRLASIYYVMHGVSARYLGRCVLKLFSSLGMNPCSETKNWAHRAAFDATPFVRHSLS